jgi:hypothetical protein
MKCIIVLEHSILAKCNYGFINFYPVICLLVTTYILVSFSNTQSEDLKQSLLNIIQFQNIKHMLIATIVISIILIFLAAFQ